MNTRASMEFCERFGLKVPILLAPMAGACPPSLSIAVANAGGMGGCGALLFGPEEMKQWAEQFRSGSTGPFQMNLWIPDPPPMRDAAHEAEVRRFLEQWGPAIPAEAGDIVLQDFEAQCRAILDIQPTAVSSIMGLYPAEFVREAKTRRIAWFATVTTVAEAIEAEAAGADAIIAQGMEAGGHRGAFDAAKAERELIGSMALIPAVVDAVSAPVIAAGGIADGRGVAAALTLGASAAVIGTGFLRCPEAKLHPAWANALAEVRPEATMLSSAFSGRPGRTIATEYARAAAQPSAPRPAPYPVQRGLTTPMRNEAQKSGDIQRMQAWAGQSAALARAEPAGDLVKRIWNEAQVLLS
jgi:nitronate monooxygenase